MSSSGVVGKKNKKPIQIVVGKHNFLSTSCDIGSLSLSHQSKHLAVSSSSSSQKELANLTPIISRAPVHMIMADFCASLAVNSSKDEKKIKGLINEFLVLFAKDRKYR